MIDYLLIYINVVGCENSRKLVAAIKIKGLHIRNSAYRPSLPSIECRAQQLWVSLSYLVGLIASRG